MVSLSVIRSRGILELQVYMKFHDHMNEHLLSMFLHEIYLMMEMITQNQKSTEKTHTVHL